MPHFGLMDPGALGPVEAPLQRARLHIRAGKRRLRQGKISAGIVTLYDALVSAMDWYVAVPGRKNGLALRVGENINDERALFAVLVRSGVLDRSFDFDSFYDVAMKASESESPAFMKDYDYSWCLQGIESVMTQFGIMPFDEGELPPEDPSTF